MDWNFIDQLPINESTDRFYDIVNNIIAKHILRSTTRRKYPAWYTFELINLIGKKSRMHAKWERTRNQDEYSEFSRLRTAVKNLITTCHLNYLYNLQLNITKNIKFFWTYTKSKRKTNSYPSEFTFNDARSSEPQEICQMFSNFFVSTYNYKPLRTNQVLTVDNMITSSRPITNIQFSVERVSKVLVSVDDKKNGGPDGIPNIFLKMTHRSLSIPLTRLFNRSLRDGVIPYRFKQAFITPIHKREKLPK